VTQKTVILQASIHNCVTIVTISTAKRKSLRILKAQEYIPKIQLNCVREADILYLRVPTFAVLTEMLVRPMTLELGDPDILKMYLCTENEVATLRMRYVRQMKKYENSSQNSITF